MRGAQDWKSKPKQQVKAWNNSMQHTYHTYIPGSYQGFPSKVASIRANAAASKKEQDFHGYSQSYGTLGSMGVHQAQNSHHRGGDHPTQERSDASHQTSDYDKFMPDSGSQLGSGGDYKRYLKNFDRTGKDEDYQKYMGSYNTHGPSNKYVPDLDELQDDERSDFIPASSEQRAESKSHLVPTCAVVPFTTLWRGFRK